MTTANALTVDAESEALLQLLSDQEKIRSQRVPGVKTVLVVLSSKGMVFDTASLRQKILLTYVDAVVFFVTTGGGPVGPDAPKSVDLLLDFTGRGMRAPWFIARAFKARARIAVGRNAGFLRPRLYDRVFDERQILALDLLPLARERLIQREVLALAGITITQKGDTPVDLGREIALELPSMAAMG